MKDSSRLQNNKQRSNNIAQSLCHSFIHLEHNMPTPRGNDRFNAEAAAWDSNPDVHRASDGALQAILAAHPSLKGNQAGAEPWRPDVLEIGCGTGLLTLRLAPYVGSVVAIDAAEGMVDGESSWRL